LIEELFEDKTKVVEAKVVDNTVDPNKPKSFFSSDKS